MGGERRRGRRVRRRSTKTAPATETGEEVAKVSPSELTAGFVGGGAGQRFTGKVLLLRLPAAALHAGESIRMHS